MELDNRQYERIAAWLDGADIELSDAEMSVAEEMVSAESFMTSASQVKVPEVAMARAHNRMNAALVGRGRYIRLVRAAASIAAAVLLVVLIRVNIADNAGKSHVTGNTEVAQITAGDSVEEMVEQVALRSTVDSADVLAVYVDDLRSDVMVGETDTFEMRMNAVESEIDDAVLLDEEGVMALYESVL